MNSIYWRRIAANIIDFIILLPFLLLLVWPVSLLLEAKVLSWPLASLLFFVLFLLLAFALYSPVLMRRKKHNGQTLGKQLLRIRVVQESSEPFSYLLALWRQFFVLGLLFLFLAWPLMFLPTIVDAIWPIWDRKGQALHDKLAMTLVTSQ